MQTEILDRRTIIPRLSPSGVAVYSLFNWICSRCAADRVGASNRLYSHLFDTNVNALADTPPTGTDQNATKVHIVLSLRKFVDLVSYVNHYFVKTTAW